jgi:ComF family protein
MNITQVFQNLIRLFYPPLCIGCSEALVADERFFCSHCLSDLPKTDNFLWEDTRLHAQLRSHFEVQRAVAYLYYNKQGLGQRLIADFKYGGNIPLGEWIGRCMANDLRPSGFFDTIDYLVPVPLHWRRQWSRGFNQSEVMAKAVSGVTGIPVDTHVLYRRRNNESQTKKDAGGRRNNVQGLFDVHDTVFFKDKHVLLIDDVMTTGSTLGTCAQALMQCENVRVSVLVLSTA